MERVCFFCGKKTKLYPCLFCGTYFCESCGDKRIKRCKDCVNVAEF